MPPVFDAARLLSPRSTSLGAALLALLLPACQTIGPVGPTGGPLAPHGGHPHAASPVRPVAHWQDITEPSGALPYPAHQASCDCCQGAMRHPLAAVAGRGPIGAPPGTHPPGLPPTAFTGYPGDGYTRPGPPQYHIDPQQLDQPPFVGQPWAPPGVARPWPVEEYIFDGGDQGVAATVDSEWNVRGLEIEDAVGHFDTLDGRTVVTPSNRVAIYAPRFAAVRKVYGAELHQGREKSAGMALQTSPAREQELTIVSTTVQPVGPKIDLATKRPIAVLESEQGQPVHQNLAIVRFDNVFKLHENFLLIRRGVFDEAEKPRLASYADAALAWSHDLPAQVTIDRQQANVVEFQQRPQIAYQYEVQGKPQLRVVKTASRKHARPGEIVEFTLRFDNIGSQLIGNVTILDNLSPRLEYVDGSAQCTLAGEFLSQENEAGSLVLRFEVTQPLPVGEGGILRFQCRVR